KGARFLMASTSEVYGDPEVHPQTEDYLGNVSSIGPRSVYDEAKRFSEAMTMAYHRSFGVATRIVRLFDTYGPRMRVADGRVVPTFLSQAIRGEALTVFGDGRQTRSFCYVSDTVDGIVGVLESDHIGPVNIGNPVEFTMLELYRIKQGEMLSGLVHVGSRVGLWAALGQHGPCTSDQLADATGLQERWVR
ncbi:MAG: NAD-dependent epimerase/dehydratase family protein, partial [Actinomycetia bacterium]|nr:NAD-dependent epimerase/dehydratase family protein [Actinomycetes bacterium]